MFSIFFSAAVGLLTSLFLFGGGMAYLMNLVIIPISGYFAVIIAPAIFVSIIMIVLISCYTLLKKSKGYKSVAVPTTVLILCWIVAYFLYTNYRKATDLNKGIDNMVNNLQK